MKAAVRHRSRNRYDLKNPLWRSLGSYDLFSADSPRHVKTSDSSVALVANNEPRFYENALIVEPELVTVTRRHAVPDPIDDYHTGGEAGGPTITQNYAEAPDGTMTACRLQYPDITGTNPLDRCSFRANVSTPTESPQPIQRVGWWMKSNDASTYYVTFNHSGGYAELVTVTPEWQWFLHPRDDMATTGQSVRIRTRNTEDGTSKEGADILVWGCHSIRSPHHSHAVVPQYNAVTTQFRDYLRIDNGSELVNDFVMACDFRVDYDPTNTTMYMYNAYRSTSEQIGVHYSNNKIRPIIEISNTNYNDAYTDTPMVQGQWYKSILWKSSVAGFTHWLDGVKTQDTEATQNMTNAAAPQRIYFGFRDGNGNAGTDGPFRCRNFRLMQVPANITEAEVQRL